MGSVSSSDPIIGFSTESKSQSQSQPLPDPLGPFRQPVITAVGILLGFILNFSSQWVKTETPLPDWIAWIAGSLILTGVICLTITLYRMLNIHYPRTPNTNEAELYYTTTLRCMMAGITMSFLGAFIDLFSNFWTD